MWRQRRQCRGVMAEPYWDPADPDFPDVRINIHKGQDGYGIYFQNKDKQIVVTKVDQGSEAQKSGVQAAFDPRRALASG